jgi:hypothetical protein
VFNWPGRTYFPSQPAQLGAGAVSARGATVVVNRRGPDRTGQTAAAEGCGQPVDERFVTQDAADELLASCGQYAAGPAKVVHNLYPVAPGVLQDFLAFSLIIKGLLMFSANFSGSIITMLLDYSLLLFWNWGAASNAFQPATRSVPKAVGASRQRC